MDLILSAFKVPLPDIVASAGIGILLVFSVLLVLIGLLYAFRAILSLFGKKEKSDTQPQPAAHASDDQAVVAAIMGAISAYRDEDGVELKVKSIKKQ